MTTPPVDLSYVYELSGNDNGYVYNIISLFLESISPLFGELNALVAETEDYEPIANQAHFLKSSSMVVKIRDMHANMAKLESMARAKADMADLRALMQVVMHNYSEALPVLKAELEKNKPAA